MHTIEKCINDLKTMGIQNGDKLLVHSSYKSLGGIENGVNGFIDALMYVVGKEGTLMFPTFTYDVVNINNPVFDVRHTKSHVGIIPEIFRNREGVKRSLHPTHSVAVWGKDRDFYIKNHDLDNVAVGENSPIFKLKDNGGKILMLGCGITHNTLIHGVEAYYKPPYAFSVDYTLPEYYRLYTRIDENDNITRKEFHHAFMENVGYHQDYDKLAPLMDMKKGYILDAESFLMDANTVWTTVLEKMKIDPFYFMKYVG